VDESGATVPTGQEGELIISGDPVMQGYWGHAEQTCKAFLGDADGARWYRTGDMVVESPEGDYLFVGRRDRMVKRRGYRIELGEIEAALYRHAAIKEAAAIALPDPDGGIRIKAFVCCNGKPPTIIELKKFCTDNLPKYMVPDVFTLRDALPKTSTDKIDYQSLKQLSG
jgi:acyl-coenzyme A synthetase/AMP-(fatty) acid ligase